MDKYITIVGTNCADPAREKEYNDWYDNIHLPDVLETPGFIGATRYENTTPQEGEARFLAIYEIETDDIAAFSKANMENMAKKREAGRMSELLVIVSRGQYKQIGSLYK